MEDASWRLCLPGVKHGQRWVYVSKGCRCTLCTAAYERSSEPASQWDTVKWREDAGCLGLAPAIFYPEDDDTKGTAEAKKVCDQCEVSIPCRETAISKKERDGIRGGLTPREREALVRHRRRIVRANAI